jgi:hypothetical protein
MRCYNKICEFKSLKMNPFLGPLKKYKRKKKELVNILSYRLIFVLKSGRLLKSITNMQPNAK